MDQRKEALIAYLQKNLKIAEDSLSEIDGVKAKIEELRKTICELETKLAGMDGEDVLRSDIEEINGFIKDLTEEPAVTEDEIVEEPTEKEDVIEEKEEIAENVEDVVEQTAENRTVVFGFAERKEETPCGVV